ncbi:hypothetical protein BJ165DRAFT_1523232 [Panaeolus papilionaceus]|nr:hypothetical protein BJ165DRAFT_1523232 [Panaeolus papilionaceus]
MSAHRTPSNPYGSDSHYRASQDGDSRRTDSTFIKDELAFHPGITASTTPADNAVANYASIAIIRSKYDLDCFYPTTLQLLAIINAVMPMAVKYSRVSYPGEPVPSPGNLLRIQWNATTIPTPLAVQNICIKNLKKHNKDVEKGIANILTRFCMSKDFDDQTKGDITELYLKPVTDKNAFYKCDMDLRVMFDDDGKPQVGYRTFQHIGIYHDLEGIRSQYLASAMAESTGPRQRWFGGVVVQEVIRLIRKLLDKASNKWMQNASSLGTSAADFVIEEEALWALPAFMTIIGSPLSTHYAKWDKYGNILFVAHCLETEHNHFHSSPPPPLVTPQQLHQYKRDLKNGIETGIRA